jgi:hypothetical protein
MQVLAGLALIIAAVVVRLRWSEFPLTLSFIGVAMGLSLIGIDPDALITSPAFLILAVFCAAFLLIWLAAFGFRARRDDRPR